MKKILIFSFFCLLCFTTSFAQKVKPVNYGGSVNLMEVRGRGGDAVVVLRTLGYGKNDALAQEDAEVRVIRALLYSGFSKDYPAVISMTESEAEAKSQGKLLHEEFPYYDWNHNKGYPTKKHRAAIAERGTTPYHRMTFNLLGGGQLELPFL